MINRSWKKKETKQQRTESVIISRFASRINIKWKAIIIILHRGLADYNIIYTIVVWSLVLFQECKNANYCLSNSWLLNYNLTLHPPLLWLYFARVLRSALHGQYLPKYKLFKFNNTYITLLLFYRLSNLVFRHDI